MVTGRLLHYMGTFGACLMLKVSFVCGLVFASLERNDLWPGPRRADAHRAWIPVVAVHRFGIRSGLPVGVGADAVTAGAGRPPLGARLLKAFDSGPAGGTPTARPDSKERPWRPA